jgi:hypothetical protein
MGRPYSFVYWISESINAIYCLCNYANTNALSPPQTSLVKKRLSQTGDFVIQQQNAIREVFGTEVKACSLEFAQETKLLIKGNGSYDRIFNKLTLLIEYLVPGFYELNDRRIRSQELVRELTKCPIGEPGWRKYEEVMFKILQFLFIPPFNRLSPQVRDESGHERRDVILFNNYFEGFWNQVGHEFNCRHLICELKNVAATQKKSLDQLRIYLSKRSIGRFGLLFIRNDPSASLLKARLNAYIDSNILVLIFPDNKVREMLIHRTFLDTCDFFLEKEKAQFDLLY